MSTSRPSERRALSRARAVAALAALALLATGATAQVLYKWTDKDGKIQYADQPPKNPPGAVTKIEVDPTTNVTQIPAPPKGEGTAAEEKTPADIASKRRALREALEAKVVRARAKLDRARSALAAASPEVSEQQVIQRREENRKAAGPGSATTGGMLGQGGMYGNAPKSNCRTDGKVTTCPTLVPSEAYYERVGKLERDVREAEDELSEAELAYRRGVD